ncbi:MAG TPA: FAD-dependent oxidoreductase [Chlamydiales bacterium]|nr:FAD-dependent oxidoreductase [Chlamydiales bacterium]
MKIAVIGAGFAGLGVSWHLCSRFHEVTLFDAKGIGGGASGIATGLMHPFIGRRAIRSWKSVEGMRETGKLILIAEQALNAPVSAPAGIFRPAITLQQQQDFSLRAKEDAEAQWLEHPVFGAGLWIPKGITLYSRLYLQGLWKACHLKGAKLVQSAIHSLNDLEEYDAIVIAAGFESLRFAPHLPLQVTKGQTLLCRSVEKLPFSLVSVGHITPTEDPEICQIGSTYEHNYTDLAPDETAVFGLMRQVAKFYSKAEDFKILEIRSGARISRPKGYRPLIEKINHKTWVFTGLGSRGLLYHAWLGKQLAQEISALV